MDRYIDEVCKIGQNELCCRYLVGGPSGLECTKINPSNKEVIDREWAVNGHNHIAKGDNCEGQDLILRKQLNL